MVEQVTTVSLEIPHKFTQTLWRNITQRNNSKRGNSNKRTNCSNKCTYNNSKDFLTAP